MALWNAVSIYEDRKEGDEVILNEEGLPAYIKRFDAYSVGRVAQVKERYHYIGDGDGWYAGEALVINDDGSSLWVTCGRSGYSGANISDINVDVAEELLTRKEQYDAEQARIKAISDANLEAYQRKPGRFAYVVGGRKQKGRSGRIFWAGTTRYGDSVGIDDGKERFFTSAYNVQVVPEPE